MSLIVLTLTSPISITDEITHFLAYKHFDLFGDQIESRKVAKHAKQIIQEKTVVRALK